MASRGQGAVGGGRSDDINKVTSLPNVSKDEMSSADPSKIGRQYRGPAADEVEILQAGQKAGFESAPAGITTRSQEGTLPQATTDKIKEYTEREGTYKDERPKDVEIGAGKGARTRDERQEASASSRRS